MPDEGTTNLFGKSVKNKNLLIGGVVGLGLIIGIGWYRSRQANNAANAASTSNASSNIDPATGDVSGSAADQAALAAQASSQYGAGASTGYGYGSVYGGGTYPYTPGTPTLPQGFTNNAEWAQAAEQYMGSSGSDSIAAAIGKYIGGAALTSDQVTTVQEAIASEGYPPVAGPDGDPPGFKTGVTTNPNPHPKPDKRVDVPNVVNKEQATAKEALNDAGFKHVTGMISTNGHAVVSAQHPAAGSKADPDTTTVRLTVKRVK